MGNSADTAQPGVVPAQGGAATDRSAAPKSVTAFRTISEVAELLETPAHVLRFWESRFPQVRPVKRAGGRRYYRPADVALLAGIRKLLHDDGLAIRGVQKMLRDHGVKSVAAPAEPVVTAAEGAAVAETVAGAEEHIPATQADVARAPEGAEAFAEADTALHAGPATGAQPSADEDAAELGVVPAPALTADVTPEDAAPHASTEAQPPEAPSDAALDEPARPRVLMRRRAAGDPPGLFSLMDAPEHPRPAPPAPEPEAAHPGDEPPAERPLAALLRAADPARLAPHAKALATLHARLEAIRARRDCAARGR